MENFLKHLLPSNHPEKGWASVLESIPKAETDYGCQIDVLKRAFEHIKVKNLLDVGAGEGAFTQTVATLLDKAGLKAAEFKIDVIEKEDSLFELLKKRIELASANRLAFERDSGKYELPEETGDLLIAIDRLADVGIRYDLIVASHVTYYFDNAGATLAYALASRLLSEHGVLWMISRDRTCELYQKREAILLKSMLPDINRHAFSDSLIDRLCCLYDLDPDCKRFQMTVNHRRSQLTVPKETEKKRAFFTYLLWLENLSGDHLNVLCDLQDKPFSEAHIFLPRLERVGLELDSSIKRHQYELNVMQQLGVVADCIDVVRRLAPDVQIHRASLASVQPKAGTDFDQHKRAEPDLPSLQPKEFSLSSVGFGSYPEAHKGDTTLSDFFERNTSFLFYPRFYFDHQCITERCAVDFSVFKKLLGNSVVTSADEYHVRKTKAPSLFESKSSQSPRFRESFDDWCKRLQEIYCSIETTEGAPAVWTMCVGSTVAADASQPFKDHLLNECCAIFLTVSTLINFDGLAQSIVPHIRVRLTQWLGHNFFVDARRRQAELSKQNEELQKQAQMLGIIQGPLRRVSDALSAMQSDTQEIRSVLFEPEESLFASHAEIAQFFQEGKPFPISLGAGFSIQHSPDKYNDEQLQLITACIVCSVFGALDRARLLGSIGAVFGVAHGVELDARSSRLSLLPLAKDLAWLMTGSEDKDIAALFHHRAFNRDVCINALNQVKNALYSPFKTGSDEWKSIALRLLARNKRLYCAPGQSVGLGKLITDSENLPVLPSPLGYAGVLSFCRDVAVALKNNSRCLNRLDWEFSQTTKSKVVVFSMCFSETIPDSKSGINRNALRETLAVVAKRAPREWRIQADSYGDRTRPFVYLVNKMLGLNERDQNGQELEHSPWVSGETTGLLVFNALSKRFKTEFSLGFSADSKQIEMKWEQKL